MTKLHIDIETYSAVSLKTAGHYKYAENCEVLMIAYGYDKDPVNIVDLTREDIPDELLTALQDPDIIKYAHNAAFERACLSAFFEIELAPEQWFCTMVLCAVAGLPLSLDQASKVLNLSEKKDAEGKNLINFFCKPCKPTKAEPNKFRNSPYANKEKWTAFLNYCKQDVETEKAITEALYFVKLVPSEKKLWDLDQRINDYGVKIHTLLARNAIGLDYDYREKLISEAVQMTGLQNPNSVKQLIDWLEEETDTNIFNLKKAEIPGLIEKFDDKKIKRVLTIRQELSKTSVKKFGAMINAICKDARLRGLHQFYGAGRTGRWGGRGVQPHNLPKGKYSGALLDGARKLILTNDAESIEMIFGAVPDLLSQTVRTAFIPATGRRLIITDFSAIEARVIAWLSNEVWRLDIFNSHGKIYEASAAQMFKVPINSITKTSDYRAKGKIAELALGYQGGVNALIAMGAYTMGLKEEDLQPLVTAWRNANPAIKKFWYDVDRAAKLAIKAGGKVTLPRGLTFTYKNGNLLIGLPSGRTLCYFRASLTEGAYGDAIVYQGLNQTTKKWCNIHTYGGKLTENIVQAVARDCLAQGMINLHEAGYKIVLHVHDEVVCECDQDEGSLEEVNELLTRPAPWMRGLPLRADGFIGDYYKKD